MSIQIEEFLSQLDPNLRKRLSNATDVEVKKQKTPSISLNNALKGGFAYGRQVMIWGNKSAGKSSIICSSSLDKVGKHNHRYLHIILYDTCPSASAH